MLRRIDENRITVYELVGNEINYAEEKIKGLIDIAFNGSQSEIDYDFFDIRGTVLLYGISGIGKTSAMNNCMSYALDKYGADCYELLTSDIVESELGKSTQNLTEAIHEFESLHRGILFIDELDRFCVNRKSNELSELKRMLIELMQFFDRQRPANGKIVLCCTNVKEQIDEALIRRFSICEEIHNPTKEELIRFANICMEKARFAGTVDDFIIQGIQTFDEIKRIFRNSILEHTDVSKSFVLKEI